MDSIQTMGLVFNIERYRIHDGQGIRTNIFLKGCNLTCPWCCNPESQKMGKEIGIYRNLCKKCFRCADVCPEKALERRDQGPFLNKELCNLCGKCAEACPHNAVALFGEWRTAESVIQEVMKDRVYFQRSGGGVTLSGGEPALQPDFSRSILRSCKLEFIHTAVETAGAVGWESLWRTVEYADEILFDIKYIDPVRFAAISPVSLQKVIANLEKLKENEKEIVLRCPIIPGKNYFMDHLLQVISLANRLEIKKSGPASFPSAWQAQIRSIVRGL